MKKKKLYRFLVYMVVILFFLTIPWVYIIYIFIPQPNQSSDYRLDFKSKEKTQQTGESEEEFLKEISSLLSWEESNFTWNFQETWESLSGNKGN